MGSSCLDWLNATISNLIHCLPPWVNCMQWEWHWFACTYLAHQELESGFIIYSIIIRIYYYYYYYYYYCYLSAGTGSASSVCGCGEQPLQPSDWGLFPVSDDAGAGVCCSGSAEHRAAASISLWCSSVNLLLCIRVKAFAVGALLRLVFSMLFCTFYAGGNHVL